MTSWKSIGSDVEVFPAAKILSPERVTIGSHVVIDDFVFIGSHRQIVIGNFVHIASHASIIGGGICILCDFANVSSGCRILSGTDDFISGGIAGLRIPSELRRVSRSVVTIDAHSIIGANAVVLPGVHVGEGATVGAGSVVTRSLEPWPCTPESRLVDSEVATRIGPWRRKTNSTRASVDLSPRTARYPRR